MTQNNKLTEMQERAKERLLTSGADGFAIDLDIDELNAVITEVWNEAIKEERERILTVILNAQKPPQWEVSEWSEVTDDIYRLILNSK